MLNLEEIVRYVREQLGEISPIMKFLSDMMIISEVNEENGRVILLVWLPDMTDKGLKYVKKRIITEKDGKIISIENIEK